MRNHSRHAAQRTAQRRIPEEYIELVLAWGRPIRQRLGRTAYHLGRREAETARARGIEVPERAVNVAVVQAGDGTLVTAIRSRDRHRLKVHGRRRARGGRR